MGNSSKSGGSSSISGNLHVQLEQGQAFSGQRVSGTIYCRLNQPLPCYTLILILKGKQKTSWTQTRSDSTYMGQGAYSTTTQTIYRVGKEKFMNYQFCLHKFNDHIHQGDFSVPFDIFLPYNLRGSFCFQDNASIQYKIKVQLETINQRKLKNQANIWIRQYMPYQNINTNIYFQKRTVN